MNSILKKYKNNKASKRNMKKDFEGKLNTRQRVFMKIFSFEFFKNVVVKIFMYVFLVGISYIILYPFITKISASFMSTSDFNDVTVKLIPRNPTLDTYKYIIIENNYIEALVNTTLLSVSTALIQTLITAIIGYGLAKFNFKGKSLVFGLVILSMVIPHKTLQFPMFNFFRYFDVFGIHEFFSKLLFGEYQAIKLTDTVIPLILLSVFGLAFKNGLYIFIFRQFYKGVPDELEEAAYVDGTGIFKTYFRIILPLTIPMMTTIFMFAFSWQWTDKYYNNLFFVAPDGPKFLPGVVSKIPASLSVIAEPGTLMESAVYNTGGILVILPLFIVFLFAQKALVQGIERSGIVG